MKTSTTQKSKEFLLKLIFLGVWILLWHIGALLVNKALLLPTPVEVFLKLLDLASTAFFWRSVVFSLSKIFSGFVIALLIGCLLGAVASVNKSFYQFFSVPMGVIKASPVASFTILLLLWVQSKNLSIVIAFLIALPIFFENTYNGIINLDSKLIEMANVFKVSHKKRFSFIYLSQLLPFFKSSCAISIGMCWKAGVAAEIIAIPTGSIGEGLYQAKIYLETPELFAWTITIIALSMLFSKGALLLIDYATKAIERA